MAAALQPILSAGIATPAPLQTTILSQPAPPPCLIVNPLSFRASRGLASVARDIAAAQGVEIVSVDGPETLERAVDNILARRQSQVIILAGDGTVRAIIDQLASLPAGSWLPDLLVLPGGRTNLIAADLTPGWKAIALLNDALQKIATQRWEHAVTERAVLRIEQTGAPTLHGFWIGGALVDGVIRRTHQHRASGHGALRTGHLSTVAALLKIIGQALLGHSGLSAPRLQLNADAGRQAMEGKVALLVATTLLHRKGWFDPYVSRAAGGMRLTAVASHANAFWRRLPRLLSGRFSPDMDASAGYLSGSFAQAEITGLHGYSLDGEAYETDPSATITLRRGANLRFFTS
ncbi:diacylglycerol kinase family protein [Xylophilus sp. GOD-11R]|uniref:diacylglycerol kinase family protein n=1 Tax=Xylophilus sp. GOD-11R TaxID=3089814 RepID=UPI00298C58DA|nr:diacylglycerol kinase family protein [Xylophilus sp. GOD-11R]WPB58948.1 diacylglycerol kinase family protein [Xylophilus sp. GOD-11R]